MSKLTTFEMCTNWYGQGAIKVQVGKHGDRRITVHKDDQLLALSFSPEEFRAFASIIGAAENVASCT